MVDWSAKNLKALKGNISLTEALYHYGVFTERVPANTKRFHKVVYWFWFRFVLIERIQNVLKT